MLLRFLRNPGSISSYMQACATSTGSSTDFDTYPKQQLPLDVASALGYSVAVKILTESRGVLLVLKVARLGQI